MSAPFIGRADELRALTGLISAARRAGAPTAALIVGEPGSGKSRLLRESLRGADLDRTVVVAGFEPGEPIPLAALGDLVRRLSTVPGDGPVLASLVFGSEERRGESALPVFEATHRAVTAFGPLVLAVDDLQWIDDQSMALLQYLLRAAESSARPLVVLAASRHSAAAVAFGKGIDGVLPEARRHTIEIRALPRDDGVALAQAIDAGLSESAAEEIWRRAAGSPFWLESLAREHDAADPLNLVGERLRTISADAGDLVGALAVVARPAARTELDALTGWPTARLDQAIRELVARGLASELPGAIRLAHDLIREAAGAAVPAATARRLHARFVDVIEASAGDDLALLAEALDHRAAAGLPMTTLGKRLVASPGRRLIGPDLFGRLSVIAEAQVAGTADQLELDTALGKLASEQGEQALAIRHWSRVAVTAEDPGERQHADLEAAWAAYAAGRAADVRTHLDRARSSPPDAVTAMQLDTVEAETLLWIEHETALGAEAARRAVARGRELAGSAGGTGSMPRETRAALLAALGAANDAALQEERAADIVELSQEALDLADSLGEEARLAALLRTAFPLWTLGLWREAEERSRQAWAISHRLILPVEMIEAGLGLARALLHLGRGGEALAIATETNALETRMRPWRRWGTSSAVLHLIELTLGLPGAIGRLRTDARHVEPHFGINVHQLAAIWLSRLGARSARDVELELESARACSAQARCPRCDRELLVVSAELHARHGRVDQARRELDEWESTYRGPGYPALHAWRARAQTAIAMASGDPGAEVLAAEVVVALEAMGEAEDALWARMDRGHLLRSSGDRQGAVAAYSEAAARAQELGAVAAGRIASRALRELGVRAWRRSTREAGAGAALHELSARELEVARLVAEGSSNREIADLLALSPRTVDRHLTNALAKLGARNRTELAMSVQTGSVRGSADD